MCPNNTDKDSQSDRRDESAFVSRSENCVVCFEPIIKGAKVCPKCQRDQSTFIRTINRFGGVVAAIGLLVTIIGASSAYFSARDATHDRELAENALNKVILAETRIDRIGNNVKIQSESIESIAKIFYESRLKQLNDIYNQSYGPCQVGPATACFSYHREMINVANSVIVESDSEIFGTVDNQNSITFRVCQRVKGINETATFTVANSGEELVMAEQLLVSSNEFLSEHCR